MFIKGFDKDLKCRGMQFEVGKEYEISNRKELELCTDSVFHYCETLRQVHQFYSALPTENNRFCEILPLSKEVFDFEKRGAKKIKIIREITGDELAVLRGLTNGNTGVFNSGDRNSGDRNSGDLNSGNRNVGDLNSGNRNSGDRNSGDRNSGDRNSSDRNVGNRNSSDRNSGNRNSGSGNSGDRNSGDRNSGDRNSGDRNVGNRNSGNRNVGDLNSGDRNSGDLNSGNRNVGNRNSGSWNSGSWNSGFFNTITPDDILVFNRPCKRVDLEKVKMPGFLLFNLMEWINFEDMSEQEKAENPGAETCDGYLRKLDYKEAFKKSYNSLSEEEKIRQTAMLKALPNFDADVFFEISGIRIE